MTTYKCHKCGLLAGDDPMGSVLPQCKCFWSGQQARAQIAQPADNIDAIALAAAQEIALMWGRDRSQFVSKIQVAVARAMRAAQPAEAQEPIWCACGDGITPDSGAKCGTCAYVDSLPSTPARQPLTDSEMREIARGMVPAHAEKLRREWPCIKLFARAVERHHGIKGEQHE